LYRVRPVSGSSLTSTFLCHWFNSPAVHDVVSGYSNGTTVTHLAADALRSPTIVIPPAGLVQAFDLFARDVQARMELTVSESATLARLRDALLPTLISGKLRVPDAERIAVEAGA
jgi:type I restriction enzyme S subunit